MKGRGTINQPLETPFVRKENYREVMKADKANIDLHQAAFPPHSPNTFNVLSNYGFSADRLPSQCQ